MNAPLPSFGHNEITARLGLLADDARAALKRVASGEDDAIAGWLAYGAAMNEGREMFPGDREFGQWVSLCQLDTADRHDRAAAMWAAASPDQFDTARDAGNARTVRGIHAKWLEIDAERRAAEARVKADAERAAAEAARQQADAERAEAKARADAEAQALREAQAAKDAAERLAAQERAAAAAADRAEAESRAKASDKSAKAADKSAKASDKVAKTNEKRAAKARSGAAPAPEKSAHVSNNSGENEWYTPEQYITSARMVMGGIDLDPASSEIANRTVKASRIFTAQDDGLAQEWPLGRIWMNPPYAKPLMGQFADKFADEVGRGSEGIVLVNNATETAWFQTIGNVCAAICFPRSRIRFLDPEGNPGAPLQGQAIIYCGPRADAFEAEFCKYGMVVRHE